MDTPLTNAERLLADGNLQSFFELINKEKKAGSGNDKFFILQESRWNRSRTDFDEGTIIREQFRADVSQITKALLGKLHESYNVDVSESRSSVVNKLYTGFVNDNAAFFSKPEKLITGKIKSILWLNTGIERSKLVCRIDIGDGFGTGTIIHERYLLTCNHVISSTEQAGNARLQFNYVEGTIASELPEYKLKTTGFFYTDPDLDFTICEVEDQLLDYISTTKPISLKKTSLKFVKDVQIIQHPDGQFMQISLIDSKFLRQKDQVIYYTSDTEVGSSGSAVFNEKWELIGIHTSAGRGKENEGTYIDYIIDKLAAEGVNLSNL